MWQYNYSQPPDELMHYGVMGMKWGQRRALRAATAAGRSAATAKDVTKQGSAAVKIFNERAKTSTNQASKSSNLLTKVSLSKHADLNKQEAERIKTTAKDHSAYYNKVAAKKTEKAYKLAAKYGDAKMKAKVDSLIKENSNKPYVDNNRFDTTDPVVKGIERALTKTTEVLKDNKDWFE